MGPTAVHFCSQDAVEIFFEVDVVNGGDASFVGYELGFASIPAIAYPNVTISFGFDPNLTGYPLAHRDFAGLEFGPETGAGFDFGDRSAEAVADNGVGGAADFDSFDSFFDGEEHY